MCSKNFCIQVKGGASPSGPPPKYATTAYITCYPLQETSLLLIVSDLPTNCRAYLQRLTNSKLLFVIHLKVYSVNDFLFVWLCNPAFELPYNNKLIQQRLVDWRRCHPQARPSTSFVAVAKFLKFQREVSLFFGGTRISLKRSVRGVEGSFHAKTSSIRSAALIELRLVTDTDWHRQIQGHEIYREHNVAR